MYLIDTDIVSLMRRMDRHPGLSAFILALPRDKLFLSVMTLGEIEYGIDKQRRNDAAFADLLEEWRDGLEAAFVDKILPVTDEIAKEWGRLGVRLGHLETDLLIAATAIVHRLTVITRNVRHFGPTGVATINPFDQSQPNP